MFGMSNVCTLLMIYKYLGEMCAFIAFLFFYFLHILEPSPM